jgi:hypothetical protein
MKSIKNKYKKVLISYHNKKDNKFDTDFKKIKKAYNILVNCKYDSVLKYKTYFDKMCDHYFNNINNDVINNDVIDNTQQPLNIIHVYYVPVNTQNPLV